MTPKTSSSSSTGCYFWRKGRQRCFYGLFSFEYSGHDIKKLWDYEAPLQSNVVELFPSCPNSNISSSIFSVYSKRYVWNGHLLALAF